MASNFRLTYNIDIVFCIDATASMGPVIDNVKEHALHFYDDLMRAMQAKNKEVDHVRVKIVSFRDYLADGEGAMQVTNFFDLPRDMAAFSDTILGIHHYGGGDEPEDGLEALAYAIRSDWSTEGTKRRQIIVVWSDASTHPLGYGSASPYYPKGMAKDFAELTEWWGNKQMEKYMKYTFKRLILYTPMAAGWEEIINNWEGVIHFPSVAGEGLKEFDYKEILDTIANSV